MQNLLPCLTSVRFSVPSTLVWLRKDTVCSAGLVMAWLRLSMVVKLSFAELISVMGLLAVVLSSARFLPWLGA